MARDQGEIVCAVKQTDAYTTWHKQILVLAATANPLCLQSQVGGSKQGSSVQMLEGSGVKMHLQLHRELGCYSKFFHGAPTAL